MLSVGTEGDVWDELARYRERYDIEDRLAPVESLERSIHRRQMRLAMAARRVEDLTALLVEAQQELEVVESEIRGANLAGTQLISEILDSVRIEANEGWSPTPVLGFRMWNMAEYAMFGAMKRSWPTPTLEATCLRHTPGDDIPHSQGRCGPPACGIYATKRLEMFPPGVTGRIDDCEAIGLVAMTGKVVEHDHGYRAATATVVAIAARWQDRWLLTSSSDRIAELFACPADVMADLGQEQLEEDIDEFLQETRERLETWT